MLVRQCCLDARFAPLYLPDNLALQMTSLAAVALEYRSHKENCMEADFAQAMGQVGVASSEADESWHQEAQMVQRWALACCIDKSIMP